MIRKHQQKSPFRVVRLFLTGVAMISLAGASTRHQLPTLASVAGDWVGMDASGAVCRLALDGGGRGAVSCMRYKNSIVTAEVRSVVFDKSNVLMELVGATPESEEGLRGTASDVTLSLRFFPSRKEIRFYRAERVLEDFQESSEDIHRILFSTRSRP